MIYSLFKGLIDDLIRWLVFSVTVSVAPRLWVTLWAYIKRLRAIYIAIWTSEGRISLNILESIVATTKIRASLERLYIALSNTAAKILKNGLLKKFLKYFRFLLHPISTKMDKNYLTIQSHQ